MQDEEELTFHFSNAITYEHKFDTKHATYCELL
jgi:hypothetical protein